MARGAWRSPGLCEDDARIFVGLCARRPRASRSPIILGTAGFYGREFRGQRKRPRPAAGDRTSRRGSASFHRRADARARRGHWLRRDRVHHCSGNASARRRHRPVTGRSRTRHRKRASPWRVSDRCRFQVTAIWRSRSAGSGTTLSSRTCRTSRPPIFPSCPTRFHSNRAKHSTAAPTVSRSTVACSASCPRCSILRCLVLLEAAPPTIGVLAEMTQTAFPSAAVSIVPDYAGLARCVKASL